jgi:hypothetical protein
MAAESTVSIVPSVNENPVYLQWGVGHRWGSEGQTAPTGGKLAGFSQSQDLRSQQSAAVQHTREECLVVLLVLVDAGRCFPSTPPLLQTPLTLRC